MGAVWRALRVVSQDSRQDCGGSVEGFEGSKLGF